MLAGLLFATHDADDRSDRLTATLPFAGATLIEYQARQLIAAGASQIIVVVGRLTPELMGALNRVGRRGVAVDPVRGAGEAAEKLHPLARVVMLADGLVTTDATVAALADEGGDVLLVTEGPGAPSSFERVGGGMAWAGVARLDPRRVADVAAMPRDYDPQSALLRVAEAAGAAHLALPEAALRDGHGIEHAGAGLDWRARRIVAAAVSTKRGWFDRWILGPVARLTVPRLVSKAVPGPIITAAALAISGIGAAVIGWGWERAGLLLSVIATLAFAIGATLGTLRGEPDHARVHALGMMLMPALAALLLARRVSLASGTMTAMAVAMALIAIGVLGERATEDPRPWWGSPPAYLLLVTAATVPGWPLAGLVLAAAYATATLAAGIEVLRR